MFYIISINEDGREHYFCGSLGIDDNFWITDRAWAVKCTANYASDVVNGYIKLFPGKNILVEPV